MVSNGTRYYQEKRIPIVEIRDRIRRSAEIAFLDVRDEYLFSQGQAFGSVSLPLAVLESRVLALVPRKSVSIAVLDEDHGLASHAAEILHQLGYEDVALSEGGLEAWKAAGGEIFTDVNTPSKAFGEWVATFQETPLMPPENLAERVKAGENIVILDARPFEEFHVMSIPGGVSAPGAELLYRVGDLAPSPDTHIVVNCAGRTRSIIGAQSLINAGIQNPVSALMNGTIGWTLAGFAVDRGATDRAAPPSQTSIEKARVMAAEVAARAGVQHVDWSQLAKFRTEEERSLYCFDVRLPEDYSAGHLPGFRSAPGGQLVQATDEYVGIRGARIVLTDRDGVQALMTAAWLRQMNWPEVYVLDVASAPPANETEPVLAVPSLPVGPEYVDVERGEQLIEHGALVIDLTTSPAYRKGHLPGAWFLSRPRIGQDIPQIPEAAEILLTSPDGIVAAYAASEVASARPQANLYTLQGGTAAWQKAGLDLETGIDLKHMASDSNDVYKRPYEGTDNPAEAMQAYIDWELQLVEQIERDGIANYKLI